MDLFYKMLMLMQPTGGTEGTTPPAGGEPATPTEAGAATGATTPTPDPIDTPAERAAADLEALQNIKASDLTWDNFLKALPGIWETYGLPLVKAIIVIIAALVIAGWLKRLLIAALLKAKVDVTLGKFLGNVARWAVLLIAGVSILGILGIETTSFAAVLAAMGFAIGLALSGSLGNLAAGVMLLLFRPFKVGDSIVTSGVAGVVDEIELFSTTLITPDNRKFIMPNGSVFNTTIENQTANPKRVVGITVTIAASTDIERARAIFTDAASAVSGRSPEDSPAVALSDVSGASQIWAVGVWAPTGAFAGVKERLLIACKTAVDKNALGLPMPQQIVNFKQLPTT